MDENLGLLVFSAAFAGHACHELFQCILERLFARFRKRS